MTEYTNQYRDLIIKQYWDQPNARAEIEAQAATWEKVRDLLADFENQIDIDVAEGASLDLLGKIVGLRRRELTEVGLLAGPITDELYRFFLRLRIANNVTSAFMVSDDRLTIQDVISFAFSGFAFVVDNQDMTLTLTIEDDFDTDTILAIIRLGLLPKPAAVGYAAVIQEPAPPAFGFAELIDGVSEEYDDIEGFAELGDSPLVGGEFSELFEV